MIFCQNLSLDAFKDLNMQQSLKDLGYKWKFLNRYIVKELMDKKFLIKIKKQNLHLMKNLLIQIWVMLFWDNSLKK